VISLMRLQVPTPITKKKFFEGTVHICQSKRWHITEEMFNWCNNANVQQR